MNTHFLLGILLCLCVWGQTSATALGQIAGPYDAVYRTAANYRGGTDTLHLKWWLPSNAGSNKIPVILWVHGGAFYAGNYVDMTANCKRWAEQGYAAISVQYRLGFHGNLFDPPYAYDKAELVRACWRGMQDVRHAIREVCKGEIIPNIDTSCLLLAGESAGSILVLQSAIADPTDSIPAETDSIATVVRGFDTWTRPSLGDLDGFPTNSKRVYIPMPRISGIINRYGALMHAYMLDAQSFPALCSFHQRSDPIVACGVNRGLYGMPLGVGDNYPLLTGTCVLVELLERGGQPASLRSTTIVEGANHDLANPPAVFAEESTFAVGIACPSATAVDEQQVESASDDWLVFDVLGQVLGSGTGGQAEAQRWVETHHCGAVFIVINHTIMRSWE